MFSIYCNHRSMHLGNIYHTLDTRYTHIKVLEPSGDYLVTLVFSKTHFIYMYF